MEHFPCILVTLVKIKGVQEFLFVEKLTCFWPGYAHG